METKTHKKGDIIYLVVINDVNGRDEIHLETFDRERAKKEFESCKGQTDYCRYESCEVVEVSENGCFSLDNNDTIESWYEEDEEDNQA